MSQFRETFGSGPVILPVVHVETHAQTMVNIRIAMDAGCQGSFLVNHSISDADLMALHQSVVEEVPDFWVGLNCLGLEATALLEAVSPRVAGVWTENAGIDERICEQEYAQRVDGIRRVSQWPGLYFGGVAFKQQRVVENVERAARIAASWMDVVVTSGATTGAAPEVDKIRRMKEAMDGAPLGIGGGVSPENIADYVPFADVFMMNTRVSRSFTRLDPVRLSALVRRARGDDP